MRRLKVLRLSLVMLMMICVGVITSGNGQKVYAYYYESVTDLKQISATKTSISVDWAAPRGANRFKVYVSEDYRNYKNVGTTSAKNFTITGLKSAKEYNVRVVPVSASGEESSSTKTLYDAKTLPDKITGFKQKSWYYFINQLYVEWDQLDAVDGYEVVITNGKGKRLKAPKLSGYSSSFGISKVSNRQIYTLKLRAYTVLNGKKYYSSYSTLRCFTQPQIKSCVVKGKKLKISWPKVSGATGYDVYVSTSKRRGYRKIKSVGKRTSSVTISKFRGKRFNKRKTYYAYVVTKKKVGKKTYNSGKLYYWNSKNKSIGYLN